MSALPIVAELEKAGVTLFLDAGKLKFKAAPGAYTDAHKALVKQHKAAIVEFLAGKQDSGVADAPTVPMTPNVASIPHDTTPRQHFAEVGMAHPTGIFGRFGAAGAGLLEAVMAWEKAAKLGWSAAPKLETAYWLAFDLAEARRLAGEFTEAPRKAIAPSATSNARAAVGAAGGEQPAALAWPPATKPVLLDPMADFKLRAPLYPEPLRSLLGAIALAWHHGHVEVKRKGQGGKDETTKRRAESQRREYSRLVAWWESSPAAATPEWVAQQQWHYQVVPRQLEASPVPRPWKGKVAELMTWVAALTPDALPPSPFSLRPGSSVINGAAWLAVLQADVARGPDTPRARTGALQADVADLSGLLRPTNIVQLSTQKRRPKRAQSEV